MIRVPLVLRLAGLVLASTAFYTYVGQMVPQKEVYPPQEVVLKADMTTADMVRVGGELMEGKGLCFTCHTVGKKGPLRFPDLEGVGARAGARIPGLSDVEYFAQSMYEPDVYIVDEALSVGDVFFQQKCFERFRELRRQGCTIRTDGQGTVYVFFLAGHKGQVAQMMARSFDGGVTFERPRPVATPIFQVGAFDAFQSYEFFDGVRGARTNSFPSVDIANGAPTGLGATDQIVLTWPDAQCETAPAPPPPFTPCLNSEAALVQYSLDRGEGWSSPLNMAAPGDRPDFPAIAISPNGSDVYLVYDGFLDPWRTDMFGSRRMQGVIRHADVAADGSLVNLKTLHRGAVGDARASGISNPALRFGFLGDYNYAVATNAFGSAVWVDTRDAALCPAINAWRQSLLENPPDSPPPAPAPGTDCPRTFGNTDIFGGTFPDPTP